MRDPATRAGYCAATAMLTFVGLAMALAGNMLSAGIEFTLAGLVSGMAIARARRGLI